MQDLLVVVDEVQSQPSANSYVSCNPYEDGNPQSQKLENAEQYDRCTQRSPSPPNLTQSVSFNTELDQLKAHFDESIRYTTSSLAG